MHATPKADESLPRSAILRKKADFERNRKEGRRMSSHLLALNWLIVKNEPRLFAVVVSKEYGKAVERNLVRRRVREAYRKVQGALPEGLRSVWIINRKGKRMTQIGQKPQLPSYMELENEMRKIYKKAGLITNDFQEEK